MDTRHFPFEKYVSFREQKNSKLMNFVTGKSNEIMIINQPDSWHWTGVCRNKEQSLEAQLEYLYLTMQAKSDLAFTYIEPWYGVGIYGAAFGCRYEFSGNESPQTRPIYNSVDEIMNIGYPSIKNCAEMQTVLEMIRYFKENVSDYIDIALTDTQSTNDTASIILDPCELFVQSIEEPELLNHFLDTITDLIIEFSDMQMEAIGGNLCRPGHIMLCNKNFKGISISDDNMAVISPTSYENTSMKYNERLSKHYGGISIHTCGNARANLGLMKKTSNLFMVDLALGTAVDPTPNLASDVRKCFENSDIIVKVKVGDEELDKITELIESDIKLIVELRMEGTLEDRNRRYELAKEKINGIKSRVDWDRKET